MINYSDTVEKVLYFVMDFNVKSLELSGCSADDPPK